MDVLRSEEIAKEDNYRKSQPKLTMVVGNKMQEQSDTEEVTVSLSVSKRKVIDVATWAGGRNGDPLQWLNFLWGSPCFLGQASSSSLMGCHVQCHFSWENVSFPQPS